MIALTPKQVQVMDGFADGLTTAQVGGRLGMSVRTVAHHVEDVADRFGHERVNRPALVQDYLVWRAEQ